MKEVAKGRRLEQPPICPLHIYQIMCSCWDVQPPARPSFRELYERLRRALQVEMDAAPPTIAPGGAYETLDDMDGDDVGEDGGYL